MAESICYCEVYEVSHSDVFNGNQNIFSRVVRQKRNCKEVKSHSVSFRKWTNTDQYFLQFKKDGKVHDHELPLIGTCLLTTEVKDDGTTVFKFYRISHSVSDTLQPILSLSVKNGDCERLKSCLQRTLQVNYYNIYDLVSEQPSTESEQHVLQITPHYICIMNKKDKNNPSVNCIIPISTGTTILYSIEDHSSDDLALKITSHNPDNIVELKFRTSHRDDILEKLQSYMKDMCTIKDDNGDLHGGLHGDDKNVDNSEDVLPPVSAPERPIKVNSYSCNIVEIPEELKPPLINRDKKPTTPVVDVRKTLTDNRSEGIRIQYENMTREVDTMAYQNVDIKTNNKALKLSVSVFASQPVLSDPWLLEIIFIRSEDFEGTFKTVENSQKSCGRHLILSCRPIQAVTGMVVILDIKSPGFQLVSGDQHISYDKLVEISSVSWLVVEKVIKYNGNTDSDVHFWSTLKLVSNLESVNEEISVFDKFKGLTKETPLSPNVSTSVTFPLTYAARIKCCQLLDMVNVLGKDWKYFAALMGLKQHEINVIESSRKDMSYTEAVLRHLEVSLPTSCTYNHVLNVFNEMERGDLTELLIECNVRAVENTDESFCCLGKNPEEN